MNNAEHIILQTMYIPNKNQEKRIHKG